LDPKPPQKNSPPDEQPTGYQPSIGRKLFMFVLCLVALIFVWTFYFFQSQHQ
jgi:hypothetical protein